MLKAVLSAVQKGIECAQEGSFFLDMFRLRIQGFQLIIAHYFLILVGGISLDDEMLHQPGGYYAAYEGSEESYQRFQEIALADHEYDYDQTHSESSPEIGEGDVLVFLEITCKALVL